MHWGMKMKESDSEMTDNALENLFEQARANAPQLPDGLMDRVLANALAAQPKAQVSGWRGWLAAIGGLPGLSGLVTATCVGFWWGVAPPAALPDLAGQVLVAQTGTELDVESAELEVAAELTVFGWDIEEGNADG